MGGVDAIYWTIETAGSYQCISLAGIILSHLVSPNVYDSGCCYIDWLFKPPLY